jgi:hypothetical protein
MARSTRPKPLSRAPDGLHILCSITGILLVAGVAEPDSVAGRLCSVPTRAPNAVAARSPCA